MGTGRPTRREVTATFGLTGLASLGGCLGGIWDDSGDDDFRRWLTPPGEAGLAEFTVFAAFDAASLYDRQPDWLEHFIGVRNAVGNLSPARVERVVLALRDVWAVEGSFDRSDVADSLAAANYEERGILGEYTYYAASRPTTQGIALGPAVLVAPGWTEEYRRQLAAVIDRRRGEVEPFPAVSDRCSQLLDGLEDGLVTHGSVRLDHVPAPERAGPAQVASGRTWQVVDDRSTITFVRLFEADVAAASDHLAEWRENYTRNASEHDLSVNGPRATVTATYESTAPGELPLF